MKRLLTLLYPIIPQVTSTIGEDFNLDLLHSEFPKYKKPKINFKVLDRLMSFNGEVWKIKKEKGISLRNPIGGINIPKELKPFEKDLIAAHNLEF